MHKKREKDKNSIRARKQAKKALKRAYTDEQLRQVASLSAEQREERARQEMLCRGICHICLKTVVDPYTFIDGKLVCRKHLNTMRAVTPAWPL